VPIVVYGSPCLKCGIDKAVARLLGDLHDKLQSNYCSFFSSLYSFLTFIYPNLKRKCPHILYACSILCQMCGHDYEY